MGFAGISPGSLLLIFCIALFVFGPKRLESLGEDLGKALRRFRESLDGDQASNTDPHAKN
ncbi:MAG: twin-arginine translocase TatA/TatE family subunit [Legionellales bacterium]|nr:twin-arginine translocase TatA/TatE family subunit [Legionellales bacterium]